MKRKGAMGKDPVLRGEARRAAKTARRAAEEGRPETSPPVRATPRRERAGERLSPGVYRGDRGGLVGQGGRQIQRQPQPPMGQQIAGGMQAQPGDYQNLPGPGGQGPQMPMDQAGRQIGEFGQMPQMPMDQGNYIMTPEIARRLGIQAGGLANINQDKMFRFENMPQMPQASANMGGQYRLSPGMYGTRDQAMQQYNQQLNNMGIQGGPMMIQPAFTPYGQRRG